VIWPLSLYETSLLTLEAVPFDALFTSHHSNSLISQLQTVMRLNDGKSTFKGRPLKFDVASPPSNQNSSRRSLNRSSSKGGSSRSSMPEVDGSSFRGGQFNRRESSSSSLRRQSSVSSETSETRQRPSLKLAPRSKPVEGQKESSASNLFGSGKARDDSEWERRRPETKQDRRGSGNGGRGGGGGGRGKGKGGPGNKTGGRGGGGGRGKQQGGKDGPKKTQQKEKEADAAPKTVLKAPPVVEPPKPSTTKVQNKFSALNMDSDSD